MSFMEQSNNQPSESKGSGGDPMSAWRKRKAERAQQSQDSSPSATPARSRSRYGAPQRSEPAQSTPAPTRSRSRYGQPSRSGGEQPQQERGGGSPFVSPGNMGGIMNTPGLPGYNGGGGGDRVTRMMDDVTSGRAQGPQMGMEPRGNTLDRWTQGVEPGEFGRFGSMDPERLQSLRDMSMQRNALRTSEYRPDLADTRFEYTRLPQPAPRPQPRGLGGLVAANNANIRGRGGELNDTGMGPGTGATAAPGSRDYFAQLYSRAAGMNPQQQRQLEYRAAVEQGFV